ncbi:hypothetical protein J2Z76_002630 [Sedimentibacter acidaminivorans]|uniref:Uncharacterized protein n=1 Tax=Sedimentibacter acidaminivorans TaxID=913099 RepID=A0ABS4GH97_9FIRM|nr:hypothetical protein [Sedimentibacter acidaminivorans]MBP1926760.1 hypothetical protein [Sedimentibacter acidaminivorans]
MNKKLLFIVSLILIMTTFTGCSQPLIYSEMYEGIPIYPESILLKSSEYREFYKISEFKGAFAEVKEFYLDNINQDIWTIKENPLEVNGEYSFLGSLSTQGYILKNKEKEVSLLIQRAIISEDGSGYLVIIINGSPLKEAKFKVEGESEHWKASLDYVLTKERIRINGEAQYVGNKLPKIVETEFARYQIMEAETPVASGSETRSWGESERSVVDFDGGYKREYELEVHKESINNAYIKIVWEEQDEIKTEKIDLDVVQ